MDRLRQSLGQLGHQVTLYAPAHLAAPREEPGVVRVPSVRTPFARRYPFAFPWWREGEREFSDRDFDLVHIHTPFMAGLLGGGWAAKHHLPLIGSFHTDYVRCLKQCPPPLRWGGRVAKGFVRRAYGPCSLILAPSDLAADWLRAYGIGSAVEALPNGCPLPLPMDRRTLRRALGWRDRDEIVLSAGRLSPEKNTFCLLAAFALASRHRPDSRLVLVGDGPLKERIRQEAKRRRLDSKVSLLGERPPIETSALFAAADLFVMPSFNETQGLAMIEAMSHGLPVVAVEGGGASSFILQGRDGLVVKADSESLGLAILKLLQEPAAAKQMGQMGREKSRKWTSLAQARALESIYFRVLGFDSAEFNQESEGQDDGGELVRSRQQDEGS